MKYFIYAGEGVVGIFYRKGKVQIGGNNKLEGVVLRIIESVFKTGDSEGIEIEKIQVQSNKFRYVFELDVFKYVKAIEKLEDVYTVQLTDSLQRVMR